MQATHTIKSMHYILRRMLYPGSIGTKSTASGQGYGRPKSIRIRSTVISRIPENTPHADLVACLLTGKLHVTFRPCKLSESRMEVPALIVWKQGESIRSSTQWCPIAMWDNGVDSFHTEVGLPENVVDGVRFQEILKCRPIVVDQCKALHRY